MSTPPNPLDQLPNIETWNDKQALLKGEDDHDAIYLAVGRTLTTWEMLEWRLALIYGQLLAEHSYAAARSYGRVTTPAVRVAMLLEVANFIPILPHLVGWPHEDALRQIIRHYRAASKMRNEIAHGVAVALSTDTKSLGVFLAPAGYNSSKNKTPMEMLKEPADTDGFGHTYRFTAAQIYEFGNAVTQVSNVAGVLFTSMLEIINRNTMIRMNRLLKPEGQ